MDILLEFINLPYFDVMALSVLSVFFLGILYQLASAFGPLHLWRNIKKFPSYYKFYDIANTGKEDLPKPPSIYEKYSYIKRRNNLMSFCALVSFVGVEFSLIQFLMKNTLLWPFYFYIGLSLIYFLDSFLVNLFSKDFNLQTHRYLVEKWRGKHTASVDIFLPTAGEPLEVLENTWKGIKQLQANYLPGVTVYCLDDAHRSSVRSLALRFGFIYEARPDKGRYKKAGNLRHGFFRSHGEFIAIFDADFVPRADFLHELLPYFYEDKRVGLVQSPQYFDVHARQNWLQRGAGAVQELFYRVSQVSRQGHNASICVGSNAVYRRKALEATGGTALIEHSEDVHTGFNMRMKGWTIQYVPVVLAKGLCPADMKAFFKQQYRWCLGSMTLLSSQKFWNMKLPLLTRMSYFSGFFYYIHTAFTTLFVPIIPLAIILLYQDQVTWQNYLLILPSIFYVQILYPLWHRATYGMEAWATRTVYGWAHVFAIADKITNNTMQWQPTGARLGRDNRYTAFRWYQVLFNFLPASIWVFLAAEKVIVQQQAVFLPLLISGLYYYFLCAKVTCYMKPTPLEQKLPVIAHVRPAAVFASLSAFVFVLLIHTSLMLKN